LPDGVPNPNWMSKAQYLALARAAAGSAAVRNGVRLGPGDVTFPDVLSIAPTRVRVALHRHQSLALPPVARHARATIPIAAKAVAAIVPLPNVGALIPAAGGGGYSGPFAFRLRLARAQRAALRVPAPLSVGALALRLRRWRGLGGSGPRVRGSGSAARLRAGALARRPDPRVREVERPDRAARRPARRRV